jgi:hypothetical protein
MKVLASATLLATASSAFQGADFIDALSTADAKCLKKNGIDVIMPRVYTQVGSCDSTGVKNWKIAEEAGLVVAGYVFPDACRSSAFA